MKENGYIRKIDELGRIVIPKELRQRLKIHDGENLIINAIDKNISLSKYSYIENNTKFINLVGDKTSFFTNFNVIITDLENIIYSNNKCYVNQVIPLVLRNCLNSRESIMLSNLKINEAEELNGYICVEPIISNSLCIGLSILYSNKNHEFLPKVTKLLAHVISIHLDIT